MPKFCLLQDVHHDTRFQKIYRHPLEAEGQKSLLCCPVLMKNKVMGVLQFSRAEEFQFEEKELASQFCEKVSCIT